ncbi:MAG TPA: endo alpha-1,4 polygalactosaminidase [Actinomycetota bacterium]|nr:endo alpha-1,4 polygalactosaminidase [Actinomycetota bacterium]
MLVALVLVVSLLAPGPVSSAPLQLPEPEACEGCWFPAPVARWQYQLQGMPEFKSTGGINVGIKARPFGGGRRVRPDVFDIDLYADSRITGNDDTINVAAVNAIHEAGARAVCYVNGGAWEDWRPDASDFPASVKGKELDGWPGERWLDIRQHDVLLPIMEARVAKCDEGGFDAVEFDNVDGYTQDSGFQMSADEQLSYNVALANLAHRYGLSVGLKNDVEQVPELVDYFDFSVNEQCTQYRECGQLRPFIEAGKAVFQVEYELPLDRVCPKANAAGRNTIKKDYDLFARPWKPCR